MRVPGSDADIETPAGPPRQGGSDERRGSRDEPRTGGTSGAPLGLSGPERGALLLGAVLTVAIIAMIIGINILTRLHDGQGRPPCILVEEGTSGLTGLLATSVPASIALWIGRRRPSAWLAAPVLALGFAAFVTLHVGGFVLLRPLGYAALGLGSYRFGPLATQVPYEAMKDVLGYALSTASFWRLLTWRGPASGATVESRTETPAVFDIQDGARWVRAPVANILAVRSAGNYVEFLLADGRRPLMRTPLSGVEARLRTQGFLRTHRSWLVNAAQVTGLRPEGSGDHTVELPGLEAPLSRRYRDALAEIRP